MRDLWKIIEELRKRKIMVRLSSFPGGHVSLGVYHNDEQYLYESKESFEDIETQLKKDFGHFLAPAIPMGMPRL